jgi:hypothetical protein
MADPVEFEMLQLAASLDEDFSQYAFQSFYARGCVAYREARDMLRFLTGRKLELLQEVLKTVDALPLNDGFDCVSRDEVLAYCSLLRFVRSIQDVSSSSWN